VLPGLTAFLAVLAIERGIELGISARNARALAARGGREHGRGHFPWFVALHVAYPLALAAEVLALGARPDASWPLWLALFLAAQALRIAAIRALGPYWNVRIWVVQGMERVRRGPYRWLAHPNYLAVAIELLAGPLLFGAWRTALLVSAANLALLRVRLRAEDAALAAAARR
jgi:methyltransferase